ncbi:uncharacterized protein LOC131426232 [Malaya genurostris]|uniref:uncharacterized protein LOC131426232 n=1 Tax=Malaya genurostris TaxID=325434 RepID=UPI0026F39DAA|nr:uncharacterized protein LOC131426232 [Malaya genurostris]
MAGQKFFHGLTEAMINRATDRPDRQKSSFYWPDEYQQDPQDAYTTSSRRQSTTASSTPNKECASPASELDTSEVLRQQRHRGNVRSNIQFNDECDSSFSQLERERQHEKLRIAAFLREQCDDVSEAAKTRRQNTLKSNFHFYDFDVTPDSKSAQNSPPKPTNGYRQSAATSEFDDPLRSSPLPNNTSNGGGTTRRQQPQYSPASSEYHYSARYTGSYEDFEDDRSYKSTDFNFSPPGTPCGGEMPECKRNSQRHLRSSINFRNGVAMADDDTDERKPVTVRDSATERVGVGLPNL